MIIPGDYDIKVTYNDGKSIHQLDQLIKSVSWSGDVTQMMRKVEISLNVTVDGNNPIMKFENGREIRFYNREAELFRGFLFSKEIDTDGQARLVAYDENVYLIKNIDSRTFRRMTASEIIKTVCGQFGIPTGTIVDTKYVFPKLIFTQKTLREMFLVAISETKKQNGNRYFIYASEGKLNLVLRKEQLVKWVIERDVNLLRGTVSASIEELRNIVAVSGGEDSKPLNAYVKNDESIKRYGKLKHVEDMGSNVTKSQVQQRAKELLSQMNREIDTVNVDALGIDDIFAGRAIYMKDTMTGMLGGYYVIEDRHTFENGAHTMSLTLSRTDDLPVMDYVEPATSIGSGNRNGEAPSKTAAQVISIAKSYVGKTRYEMGWGRTESDRANSKFDCSSFVKYVFSKAGVNIGGPFSGVTTDTLVKEGREVSERDLQPGDLIFAHTYKTNGHVLIYVGDGNVIGCGRSGTKVNKLSYWKSTYGIDAIRRVL